MFGASLGELSFVALMVVVVLLSQVAPRVGEAIGARFEPPAPPVDEGGSPPRPGDDDPPT